MPLTPLSLDWVELTSATGLSVSTSVVSLYSQSDGCLRTNSKPLASTSFCAGLAFGFSSASAKLENGAATRSAKSPSVRASGITKRDFIPRSPYSVRTGVTGGSSGENSERPRPFRGKILFPHDSRRESLRRFCSMPSLGLFCARGHPPGSMQVATSQPSTDACRPASFPPARYAPDAGCASAGWTRGRPVFSAVTYRLILGVDPLIGARSGSREGTFPWSSQQM